MAVRFRLSLSIAIIAAAVIVALVFPPPVHAATIRVPSQQPTLQLGIDAAAAGDTVLVAAGTYAGPGNKDLDFHGRDVVLRSQSGPHVTIIDCASNGRGFHLQSGETNAAIIEGFTVRRGAANAWPDDTGGAVLCAAASPTIRGCTFIHNYGRDGGALALIGTATRLEDCIITENRADNYGGGIAAGGGTLEITRCLISLNSCGADYGGGGGVSFGGGTLTMTDCTVRDNRAENYGDDQFTLTEGGGLDASGSVRLTRCVFWRNIAASTNEDSYNVARGGGAFFLTDDVILDECVFRSNTVQSISDPSLSQGGNVAYGGGLMCSAAALSSCVFEENDAHSEGNPDGNYSGGGGLYCDNAIATDCLFDGNSTAADPLFDHLAEGGGAAAAAGSNFVNCTFGANSAATGGAAIHVRGGFAIVENTILAFSLLSGAVHCTAGGSPVLVCSDVYGNSAGDWVGCIAGQAGLNGNFAADPLFCRPVDHNYTLDGDSPCAPEHSPGQCGLVGALPVSCGVIGVAAGESPGLPARLRLSPNPHDGNAVLEWNGTGGGTRTVRLYDLAGRLLLSREVRGGSGRHELDWSELAGGVKLPAGVYFLKLEPLAPTERPLRIVLTK